MKTHETKVAEKFNKASLTYNQHAHAQVAIGKKLIKALCAIKDSFSEVLDAGCGTGLTTQLLADSISFEIFDAIDIAKCPLSQASMKPANINYAILSYDDINHNACYDLIFSNMALHWSNSLRLTLNRFHSALDHNGLLAFSIPLEGTFVEIKNHFSIHQFYTFKSMIQLLQDCGFRLVKAEHSITMQKFPDTLSALRSIKLTGANHVANRLHKSLRGKASLTQINCTQLSYRIGYFIVEKQHG